MRRIAAVTGTRAEYGPLFWILHDIRESRELELRLLVTGAHLEPAFGRTIDEIRRDGFAVAAEIPLPLPGGDDRGAVALALAAGVRGFAEAFERERPDVVLLTADRYETFAAAIAGAALGLPLAHVSGGESTLGLFDDQFRHAISKLAHLHFVSMEPYRQRLLRMGEPPERVHTVGEPGLEHCRRTALASAEELSAELGLDVRQVALVSFHPVTLELEHTAAYVQALLSALDRFPELPLVMTYPGADPGSRTVIEAFEAFVGRRGNARLRRNLGSRLYLGLLRAARLLVGNSSSGISESGSFALPVVNAGNRQGGRIRGRNVIDVECTGSALADGIARALAPGFREELAGMDNPYGDGRTAARVLAVLRSVELAPLRYKVFHDA